MTLNLSAAPIYSCSVVVWVEAEVRRGDVVGCPRACRPPTEKLPAEYRAAAGEVHECFVSFPEHDWIMRRREAFHLALRTGAAVYAYELTALG